MSGSGFITPDPREFTWRHVQIAAPVEQLPRGLRELRLSTTDHAEHFLLNHLVAELSAEVAAEHLITQDVPVTVRGFVHTAEVPRSVLVELPNPWWRRLLRRPARSVWCPVVGDAVIHGAGDRIPVVGSATVPVSSLHLFPEARDLPERFGNPVRYQEMGQAIYRRDWRADDRGERG